MARKKEDKWSVGDKVTLPVEFVIVAIGGVEGKEEVALTPVDAHVNHVTAKLSDLPG